MSDQKGPKVELPEELLEEIGGDSTSDLTALADDAEVEAVEVTVEKPAAEARAPEAEPAAADEPEGDTSEAYEQLNEKFMRLAADYDNFRRRTLRERAETQKYGNENLIKELLGTVDNLERAVDHGQKENIGEEGAQLLEGVQLVQRSFMQTLEKFGVQEVAALGETFDPNVHEAIRQVPHDEYPSGAIAAVFQTGYLLSDRLLRPALVAVSSGPGEKPDED